MINTKYLLCISTCLLVSGNMQASDINLTYDSSGFLPDSPSLYTLHTPSELRPTPFFNTKNAVKLAAVCSVGGGGCNGLSFGSSDNSMDLDRSAQCEDEGFVNSCPSGYVPDTTQRCPHSNSYFKCRPCINNCDSGYSLTSCSNTQVQTAAYKNECTNTCYQCRYKTCEEGDYASSINSCQNGTAISFANKTCYRNVSAKTCENGGYKSSVPTNNKCTAVNYCSKTCQSNCYQPSCSDGGYYSSIPTNNVCTDVSYYGRTCKKDCYQPTCENGNYKSGIPNNQVCSSVSYYGRTCYQNCYQPTCENGGYKSSIPTNNKCTSVSYYGRTCQKDCYQLTCDAGGYLDACPDGHTCTAVTYYGKNCYKNCKTLLPILYSDMTTANEIISGKTPIGIVFDTNNKFAMALEESPNTMNWGKISMDIPALENCYTGIDTVPCDIYGKANTAAIIAYGKANNVSYPAAEYCNRYVTAGTKAGDWHLPSLYELKSIFDNKDIINAIINLLGKGTPLDSKYHWSSNEFNMHYSWILYMKNGNPDKNFKDDPYRVRPVLALGEMKDIEIKCQIGSVLYEDKKCYSYTTKTPIAVVFDPDKKLAMALTDSGSGLEWGGWMKDIPSLANCELESCSKEPLACDIDGKANTAAIIAYGKAKGISYPAAEYCNRYVTAGTKAGDWHLPSLYELKSIFDNRDKIELGISKIDGTPLKYRYYWSSNNNNTAYSWILYMDIGCNYTRYRTDNYRVRPVLAY